MKQILVAVLMCLLSGTTVVAQSSDDGQFPCSPYHIGMDKIDDEFLGKGYEKHDALVSVYEREGELYVYTDIDQLPIHAALVLPNGCVFIYHYKH